MVEMGSNGHIGVKFWHPMPISSLINRSKSKLLAIHGASGTDSIWSPIGGLGNEILTASDGSL